MNDEDNGSRVNGRGHRRQALELGTKKGVQGKQARPNLHFSIHFHFLILYNCNPLDEARPNTEEK